MTTRPLSTKQSRFITAYIASNDAKQAAIEAGYSQGSIAVEVCRLLKNKHVTGEIERLKALPASLPGKVQDTSEMTPMAFLMAIMNDEREDPARRLQAAAKLLPYTSPKPQALGKKEARQAAAGDRAATSDRFAVPKPPRFAVVS